MTSKFKILLSVFIIAVLAVWLGISKWSSKDTSDSASKQTDTSSASEEKLAEPTGNVDDLFASIDASIEAEDRATASDTDQIPSNDGSDYDQSVNTNEI